MTKPTIKQSFTIKIALLYIIEKYGIPIREHLLTEVAISVCEINYFTLRQCLYELEQIKYVEKITDGSFLITETGHQSLSFFVTRLNIVARQSICDYIANVKVQEKRQSEFECTYYPADDMDYFVRVIYKEDNSILLDLAFRAGKSKDAEKICQLIKQDRNLVYTEVYKFISSLDTNKI